MIDVSKIKVGDEGTVRVRFIEMSPFGNFKVETVNYPNVNPIWASPSDIASHTPASPPPRVFKPGDRVTYQNLGQSHEIVALDAGQAWLKTPTGHFTAELYDLRHADERE